MHYTSRLYLRPCRKEDAPALLHAIADHDIVRNLASAPWPYDLRDAEALAGQEFNTNEPRHFIFLGDHSSSDLIGVIGLDKMTSGEVELGYWIAKAHWNHGYASEAARLMIEIARTDLGLKRLFAAHFIDNPASGHVLRKLGFKVVPGLVDRQSRARGGAAQCQVYVVDF
ncbi:GNAT family N-acetyltransferase [Brevundimonas sp.]